jgi:hypothetical protein
MISDRSYDDRKQSLLKGPRYARVMPALWMRRAPPAEEDAAVIGRPVPEHPSYLPIGSLHVRLLGGHVGILLWMRATVLHPEGRDH